MPAVSDKPPSRDSGGRDSGSRDPGYRAPGGPPGARPRSARPRRRESHRRNGSREEAARQGPATRPLLEGSGPSRALARYWRRTRRFTGLILALWFIVTFLATWFARELDVVVFGWPLSFWLAAQGVPVFYLVLVIWYGRHMERLDRRYGVEERDLS